MPTKPSINWRLKALGPWQNGCHSPDDIFKCFFSNGDVKHSIKIWLKFFPNGPIKNIPALVQIMVSVRGQAIIWTDDG